MRLTCCALFALGGALQIKWAAPPITFIDKRLSSFLCLPTKRSPLPYAEPTRPCPHVTHAINGPIPSPRAYSVAMRG